MKILNSIFVAICLLPTFLTAEPIEASKLFDNPKNAMVSLSPNGKYVANYYRNQKDHYISLVKLENNINVSNLRIGNDNWLNAYYWLNNSQLFANVENADVNVNFIGDIKDGKIEVRLIKTKGYLVHTLPEKHDKVMFARIHGRFKLYYKLYIVDIESLINDDFSNAQELSDNTVVATNYFYNKNFQRIITNEYHEKNDAFIVRYKSINGGKWHVLLELKEIDYSFKALNFISEDKLAVMTNKDSDKIVLREFDIKQQKIGKIIYQHPKYDLISAGFLPSGKLNYVKFKQHGLTKTRYFDKGTEKFVKRLTKTFTNQEVYFVDKDSKKERLLFYVNGSDQPGEYFVYDSTKDLAHKLLLSYPELVGNKFAPSQLIEVTTKDGTKIEAFLTLPKDIDHSTLLVMPHGGPIDVQESDRFNKEVQFYASRGFAVLRINFRGSAGFGKAFMDKGVGEFGRLIEEDITAAVDRVSQIHKFKHMCSMGASYGGYSAVMLAIKQPERYECVIGAFGVYDLPLLFNASNYRSTEEYREYIAKTVGELNKNMVDYSPVYLSEKLKAPILLIAGRKDDTADFEHSNRFHYVLERNKHPVEKMFYKNEAHGHKNWSGDHHEAALIYDFLMRTLKLTMPNVKELDELAKKAIADDYAAIADGYEFGIELKNDKKKAFVYYEKAAAYGHGRANYNLASKYHTGEEVVKDLDKAVAFYRKSATQDFALAYGQLGRMHMEGEHIKQNWQKAYEYLTKAQQLDDISANNIMLARFFCTAPKKFKNVNRCIELMDIDQYKDRSKSIAKKAKKESQKALAWIIADGIFSFEEKKRIKKLAKKTFELNEIEATLDVDEEGEFTFKESTKFGKSGEYELIDQSFKVKAKDNVKGRFGIKFEVDVPGINNRIDQVAVVARWVQTNTKGERKIFDSWLFYGSPKNKWNIFAKYKDIEEAGTWQLEVYDLDQNQLYSQDFEVVPLDEIKEDKES